MRILRQLPFVFRHPIVPAPQAYIERPGFRRILIQNIEIADGFFGKVTRTPAFGKKFLSLYIQPKHSNFGIAKNRLPYRCIWYEIAATGDVASKSDEARELIERDQDESNSELLGNEQGRLYGQQTRETFHLADFFIDGSQTDDSIIKSLDRFFDAMHGNPTTGPTQSEYFMFLAQASALRSGDLSRQVGAVVVSEKNEVCGIGVNDVPKWGGGQYWTGDEFDFRDWRLGFDANKNRLKNLMDDTLKNLKPFLKDQVNEGDLRLAMKKSRISDITEYGRPVHAEMSAILSCARTAVSTMNAKLYCTTYPCHNCAKHIIAAGVAEVFYIEPYPKSMASILHRDALIDEVLENSKKTEVLGVPLPDRDENNFVKFKPFIGASPARFIDLFSMKLGQGDAIKRNDAGNLVQYERTAAILRFSARMVAIERGEADAAKDTTDFETKLNQKKNNNDG